VFDIGWNARSVSRGGTQHGLGLNASLIRHLSTKSRLEIDLSRDFGTSPKGEQERNTHVRAIFQKSISEEWSMSGGTSFRAVNYPGRRDIYWEPQLSATYSLNSYLSLVATYVFRDNRSPGAGASFSNSVFSLGANIRY
jgi:hypothetical protein